MKRMLDVLLSLIAIVCLVIPMLFIAIAVKSTSKGDIIYFSDRVGKGNIIFQMPKFRTMLQNSPQVATHLLINPDNFLTPVGKTLRRLSLDELPQLFTILFGKMSFVGPRPALFNQEELIVSRSKKNINSLLPGLTGWAQVNGRDDISIKEKICFDEEYLNNRSLLFDLRILWMTFCQFMTGKGVSH